jgi:hypothetical protein
MKNKDIIEKVSREFGIDITVRSRKRMNVYARAVYYKLSREILGNSLGAIGSEVGTDHATVIHSLKNIFPIIEQFEPWIIKMYKRLYDEIEFEIGQDKAIPRTHEEAKKEIANLRYRLKIVEDENKRLVKVGSFHDLITRIPDDKVEIVKLRLDAMIKML